MADTMEPNSTNGQEQERPSQNEATSESGGDLVRFLQTETGASLAHKGLDILEGLRASTIDARAAERSLQLEMKKMELQREQQREVTGAELNKLQVTRGWWFQVIGMFVVVGGIIALSLVDRLTPAAGTILGAVAGYLFGGHQNSDRSKKAE